MSRKLSPREIVIILGEGRTRAETGHCHQGGKVLISVGRVHATFSTHISRFIYQLPMRHRRAVGEKVAAAAGSFAPCSQNFGP